MDRLAEKLALAAGVNARVAKAIEDEADTLIARETQIAARAQAAFAPHHVALDARKKELDRFEDSLQILENANPLADTGDPAPLISGSTAPTEPGLASGADKQGGV